MAIIYNGVTTLTSGKYSDVANAQIKYTDGKIYKYVDSTPVNGSLHYDCNDSYWENEYTIVANAKYAYQGDLSKILLYTAPRNGILSGKFTLTASGSLTLTSIVIVATKTSDPWDHHWDDTVIGSPWYSASSPDVYDGINVHNESISHDFSGVNMQSGNMICVWAIAKDMDTTGVVDLSLTGTYT